MKSTIDIGKELSLIDRKKVRIEFQNDISSGMYTGISELVACFYMKPYPGI